MKTIFSAVAWSLILGFITIAVADEKEDPDTSPKYSHDFSGQDLTKQNFAKKNLDNSNFADADLTEASFEGVSLKNCNFRGATLKYTKFYDADLTGSDFREATFNFPAFNRAVLNKANFSDVDLNSTILSSLKLREAIFRNTVGFNHIYSADFYMADVRGADFSKAFDNNAANFRKAKSDQFTRWYDGFDVKARGLTVVVTKEEPAEEDADNPAPKPGKPSKPKSTDPEAEFQKLDKNEDGALSGSEMKGFKDRDTNEDGEVTLAEFLAGAAE